VGVCEGERKKERCASAVCVRERERENERVCGCERESCASAG